ncbi:MAG: flagellar biosynthetic protein FliO, partial [Magnetococcales bacterium]|nr:flagellar biosynthetic protein FliO [Magnetococcales bacterium]
ITLAPGAGVRIVAVGKRAWLLGVSKERVEALAELTPEDLEEFYKSDKKSK